MLSFMLTSKLHDLNAFGRDHFKSLESDLTSEATDHPVLAAWIADGSIHEQPCATTPHSSSGCLLERIGFGM
jgi:hypothetical protein